MIERLEVAPGWRVITKFEAKATFFIPNRQLTGWNSTDGVDGGGKVSQHCVIITLLLIQSMLIISYYYSFNHG
jgi:hypothetical protein